MGQSGDEQGALVDDLKPLYERSTYWCHCLVIMVHVHIMKLFINVEMMIASLLGDRSLYKGEFGVVYFLMYQKIKECTSYLHKHIKPL